MKEFFQYKTDKDKMAELYKEVHVLRNSPNLTKESYQKGLEKIASKAPVYNQAMICNYGLALPSPILQPVPEFKPMLAATPMTPRPKFS